MVSRRVSFLEDKYGEGPPCLPTAAVHGKPGWRPGVCFVVYAWSIELQPNLALRAITG